MIGQAAASRRQLTPARASTDIRSRSGRRELHLRASGYGRALRLVAPAIVAKVA
jgi:hypothetical protein